MRIESGPAKADRNWQLVRAVLFFGFAAWFVYDGAVHWPAKTRAEAEKRLAGEPFRGRVAYAGLDDRPTEADLKRLPAGEPTAREKLYEVLGQPELRDGADEYFVGRYGFIKATVRGGLVTRTDLTWTKWYKSRAEMVGQFYWAVPPALIGLYFLWRLYKAVTLRVVVDDEGIDYGGQRIAYAEMVSLRDYNPKGWIDLYYRAGDRERKLRLDNEKVALFDEIVAAICEAKGFTNEVRAHAELRAREQAEREAAVRAGDAAAAREDADENRQD